MSLLEKVFFVIFTTITGLWNWGVSQYLDFFKCAQV